MVIGGQGVESYSQSRALMSQWLHQEPFFRLLEAQGYAKIAELRTADVPLPIQPADVLIWYKGDGTPGHAAFAMSDALVFQKHGQGWESPWQVLRIEDVWYNQYLQTGGHIAIHRSVE